MGSIKVTGLCKAFGIEELFNDVSFEIKRGERVGFVGANGAGKSTLMKCLLNKVEYDKGTVSMEPVDTISLPTVYRAMTLHLLQMRRRLRGHRKTSDREILFLCGIMRRMEQKRISNIVI